MSKQEIDRYIKQTVRVHGYAMIAGRRPDGFVQRVKKIAKWKGMTYGDAFYMLYSKACEL